MISRFCLTAAFALAATQLAQPAAASLRCEVLPTPDGFVALREAPSRKSSMMMRLTMRHTIVPTGGVVGPWSYAAIYTGTSLSNPVAKGWVYAPLIGNCG